MAKTTRSKRRESIKAVLAAARREAGLSQRDLAARLHWAPSRIARIETGAQYVAVLDVCEVAEALGLKPLDLFIRICDTAAC